MLDVTRDGGVVRIALDRPQQRNALSLELIAALRLELAAAASDPAMRLVVLSGRGPSFCAGADSGWLRALTDRDEALWERATSELLALLVQMTRFEKPLLARLHGNVVGAGVALAACCDHVLCEDTTRFLLPELRLGMAPSVVSPFLIAKLGPAVAKSLLMAEPDFPASRAVACGLVQAVRPAGEMDAAEDAAIKALTVAPAAAMAEFKRMFLALTLPDLDRQAELAFACARQTFVGYAR
jgi:methylglutaconyl-CoA hydratase